jgi:hypothetical protein
MKNVLFLGIANRRVVCDGVGRETGQTSGT